MSFIELKTARYKGVEFLFSDMPTTGGNRLIKFNYPGSDKQSIERQGKAPRTFTLTAIIPHEDYFQQRDNLLRVLEDGVAGVLTHPTFGDVENVINGRYTLTEKLSEIGRAEVVIPFEVDDSPGIPRQSGNLASQVQTESGLLNDQLQADLADTYEVSLSSPGNFTDARANMNTLLDTFDAAANSQESVASNLASFRASLNSFRGNIGGLVRAPTELSEQVSGLFADFNNLFAQPADTYAALTDLFDFGADDPVIQTNTVGRIQRKQNRDAVRVDMRAQALSYAYVNAAEVVYDTTEDLEAVQTALEAQYVDIRENQDISNAALEQLDRVRVRAQATLAEVSVSTRSIITVETPLRPLSVLVYEYYGSTDLVDTIADLNDIQQNAFVEGSLRILSS